MMGLSDSGQWRIAAFAMRNSRRLSAASLCTANDTLLPLQVSVDTGAPGGAGCQAGGRGAR